ncbi:HNH endonuclease [Gulosibacter massiliensis]|uniref:HNH endonuclease n=1 Tax=Gulosibacter massiliensis TaxID=2479839 RepID=UPI000F6305FC|nr:DUF222 domain-containing protein [Gulosibacter massiliensis]
MSVSNFSDFSFVDHSHAGRLRTRFTELMGSWESLTHGRGSSEELAYSLTGADDADVLDFLQHLGALQRQLGAAVAVVASEVAVRSDVTRGEESLARRNGCRDASDLVAEHLRTEKRDADAYVRIGKDVVGRERWNGERFVPPAQHVATALYEGELGIAHANEVVKLRRRMAPRVLEDELAEGEREIVEVAKTGMRLPDFRKVEARLEAQLDPDGLEPSFRKQRRERSVKVSTDIDTGMLHVKAKLDPEAGMYVAKFFEAYCTNALRTSRGNNVKGDPELPTDGEVAGSTVMFRPTGDGGEPVSVDEGTAPVAVDQDTRSIPQMQADALVEACKHLLGCAQDEVPGVTTTVLIRMHAEGLREHLTGKGEAAESEGGAMLDAGNLRRRASAANIIPVVLGGDSEVLDLGREHRHFSRAQRLALVERDGGCAFCGLPPGMTEAHHIAWWKAHDGTTDLDNGILLCTSCHHRVHEGWGVRITHEPGLPDRVAREKSRGGGTVWFIPPEHLDWTQEPRLGGRKRFDIGYRLEHPPTPLPETVGRSW